MIRHRVDQDFWLVTQNEHAVVAGLLAAHVGGHLFTSPLPYRQTVDAIALHDSGWALHDDAPTLNPQGLPLHVFETPPRISVSVWSESIARAVNRDPYSGLLVSLHVLRLASLSFAHWQSAGLPPHELFQLTRFQHDQVEMQEALRQRLDLRVEGPLSLGLGRKGASADEDLLRFNSGLLRLLDMISLELCGADSGIMTVDAICPRPASPPIELKLSRDATQAVVIEPWPFDVPSIELQVPLRRVGAEPFSSAGAFRAVYADAPVEHIKVVVESKRAMSV